LTGRTFTGNLGQTQNKCRRIAKRYEECFTETFCALGNELQFQLREMSAGRPTDYTPELATAICAEIGLGHSLRTICKADSMPCVATIFNWLRLHPEFLEQYTRAKEEQADALAEEMLDLGNSSDNGGTCFASAPVAPAVNRRCWT
jgi:hypothetical protein